ncbi:hypothetical protein JW935_11005 [candidate division KSB1 bacterium]|nr:hypothetical protein [candidate division KSB1 bacterium]
MRCCFSILFLLTGLLSCTQNENDRKAAEFASQMRSNNNQQSSPGQSASQLSGRNDTKPASFTQLKRVIPDELEGLPRQNLSGHTSVVNGITISRAQATYGKEPLKIELMIVDLGSDTHSSLLSEFNWYNKYISIDNENNYNKTFVIDGNKAFHEYDKVHKKGRISTIVYSRFGINLTGENVDMEMLLDAIDMLNINALNSIMES